MREGSLSDTLKREESSKIKFDQRIDWIREIASGLNYLHNEVKIICGDLTSKRILLHNNKAKIAALGFSRYTPESIASKNDLIWMAPELSTTKTFTFSSDIWSFGLIMFEIISGVEPFAEVTETETLKVLINTGALPKMPKVPNESLVDLYKICCNYNPVERQNINFVVDFLERSFSS
eukprot:TRINITY_DN670_c0_g1_i1.p1 TRINITY_DN670_c0_g1~~TRINITY_DN670_c0_g1_i1.p1  ORF type:complete len:202 (-),score=19.53 TRINITY_DN670_c0_g1_i1:94-627(-)